MKEIRYVPASDHIWRFEKEDNPTGMQMKIWCIFNHTEIVVRLYNHSTGPAHKLFSAKTSQSQMPMAVLGFLVCNKLILREHNWELDAKKATEYWEQDEFEDKDMCLYFVWKVTDKLLKF